MEYARDSRKTRKYVLHLHPMPTWCQTGSGKAAPSRFKREDGSEMGKIWNMQIASSSSGLQIVKRLKYRARPKGGSQAA